MTPIAVVSFAASLMLSAQTLVLAGNLFGRLPMSAPVFLLISVVIFLFLIRLFDRKPFVRLKPGYFEMVHIFLGILTRMIVVVFLSTGLLVSSGFAFNEIFVYWFPNFGFAFLLLAFLTGLQWLGSHHLIKFQIAFSFMALTGLALLIIKGLISTEFLDVLTYPQGEIHLLFELPAHLTFFILLFVGVDLGYAVSGSTKPPQRAQPVNRRKILRVLYAIVIGMAGIFTLWGIVLLSHLDMNTLSNSSINHLIGARLIWGQTGRVIMGLVIISGTCAAITALYFSIRRELSQFGRILSIPVQPWVGPRYIVLFLTLIIGVLMGFGLAGHQALETLIKASFIVWLLWYGMTAMAAVNNGKTVLIKTAFMVVSALMIWAAAYAGLTDEDPALLFKFLFSVVVLCLGMSAVFVFAQKRTLKGCRIKSKIK